jgi:polygalacturonase
MIHKGHPNARVEGTHIMQEWGNGSIPRSGRWGYGGNAILAGEFIGASLALASTALGATTAQAPVKTQWGTVSEPSLPGSVCSTLVAQLTPTGGSLDAVDGGGGLNSKPDTSRIQSAIDGCGTKQAVRLVAGSSGRTAFLTGPITLKSGVTLWVDTGVTLFASRNPKDYDKGAGNCGTADKSSTKTCNPLILAANTKDSGVVGDGIIDGRGGSLLTTGPNAGKRSWWDVAYQTKSQGLIQHNPRMFQINNGSNFTFYRITIQNSPNFHVMTDGLQGFTVWGVKVVTPSAVYTKDNYACPAGTTPDTITPATCFTPDTVKNTDAIDPGQSSNVLMAYTYITTGDDNVAIKAGSAPTSKNLTFAHNHFYYGHGLSIGSETNSNVDQVMVTDLSLDGGDSANNNGIRIKSDSSRGGSVTNVTYDGVCIRNERRPLVFDPFYSSSTGSKYPKFYNIRLANIHSTGSSKYKGGLLTFLGYKVKGQNNLLGITLDNVVFDQAPTFEPSHNGGQTSPADANFILGPGPVSFVSLLSSGKNVTIKNNISAKIAPYDCTKAFVPLKSVAPTSPF